MRERGGAALASRFWRAIRTSSISRWSWEPLFLPFVPLVAIDFSLLTIVA